MQDGYTGTANITITVDNMIGGPKFSNPSANNYSLLAGSPCVDAGNNTYLSYDDMIDLAGNPRIYNNVVDMGAYECFLDNVSIAEIVYGKSVRLYPSPTKGELTIEGEELRINRMEIVDVSGKTIYRFNKLTNQINVSALSRGIYFVKIETDKGIVTRKFVKE